MAKKKLLEEIQSFAVLTEEIGSGRAPRPATPGSPVSPGTSQLGQIVDGALREVLGWRPRATDAQGFVAALNQSFSVKEAGGHIEWKWTPRSYAVAAELGAVTGAQASIYTRAKAMLDQSIPLLEDRQAIFYAYHDPGIVLQQEDIDYYRYHPLLLNAAFLGDLSSEDQRVLGFGDKRNYQPAFVRPGKATRLHQFIAAANGTQIRIQSLCQRISARLRRIF